MEWGYKEEYIKEIKVYWKENQHEIRRAYNSKEGTPMVTPLVLSQVSEEKAKRNAVKANNGFLMSQI